MKNNHKGLEFLEQSSQGHNGDIGVEPHKRFISMGTQWGQEEIGRDSY